MTAPAHQSADPLETATDWFARRRSGEMTAADAQALEAWLAADPVHAEAYQAAERMWLDTGLDAIREHPRILALRERGLNRTRRRRWMVAIPAVAACLAVIVAAPSMLGPGLRTPELFAPSIQQEFRTSVGQRTTVKLPDGTAVTLDTDTVLRTRETETRRMVWLDKGQAFFRVHKDPSRPFIVAAGDHLVRAIGTAFDVRVDADHFDRWLDLFEQTAREVCPPAAAEHFIERARRIAQSLELGIAGANGVMLLGNQRYRRSG